MMSRKYIMIYTQPDDTCLQNVPQKPDVGVPVKLIMVDGNAIIDIAKIIGITPASATLIGI